MIDAVERYVVRLGDKHVQIVRDLGLGMNKGLARIIDQWYSDREDTIPAHQDKHTCLTPEAVAQRAANYKAGAIKRTQTIQERNSQYKHGLAGGVLRDHSTYPTKQEK